MTPASDSLAISGNTRNMTMSAVSVQPILYSFRRCPFAIRARMALAVSAVRHDVREISLRAKPELMLDASPKATVPVLVLPNGRVIDESLDIMRWALAQNDPDRWLASDTKTDAEMRELIEVIDSSFKFHLDRMKYANRFPSSDPAEQRVAALKLLAPLEHRLNTHTFLFGVQPRLADVAIFPFVRQFAHADAVAFAAEPLPALQAWLARWESSALFAGVMTKLPLWAMTL